MESGAGLSLPTQRPHEPILSITLVFTGQGLFLNVQYFWLIITDKRIIYFKTDDIFRAASKKQDRLMRLLSPDETSIATRDKIRAMHPSAIKATYPSAVIIPVSAVVSFVCKQEFWYLFTEFESHRWILEITSPDKTGRNKTIRLSTPYYPTSIVEIKSVRDLFGNRLVAPKQSNYGWNWG